ncbi:uncharacterized protein A1O9_01510 [Exophiala aquamarina CBS 119918]|uniref:Uncharacterized protein n=1 Tax=Exophiala aquamarina CBS 119918 TaxID=1182545 RepID=A0A072PUU0_9EURO|nr:uncharacterized protein A1O9_01510 [Exophiala aquamarina CBS 119918]KEF63532.1 hypothetical protein A1O9_01510 [Exophiala aquamarina CBS 119918]
MQSQLSTTSPEDSEHRQRSKRPRLTASQLERKRELDRDAQRLIRAKTKSRIAHLESLVSILQAPEATNTKTSELIAQVNSQKQEIDKLRDALAGISRIVSSAGTLTIIPPISATLENILPPDPLQQSLGEPRSFTADELSGGLQGPPPSEIPEGVNNVRAYLRDEISNLRQPDRRVISETVSLSFDNGTSSSPEDFGLGRSQPLIDSENGRKVQFFKRGTRQKSGSRGCVSQIANEILQKSSLDGRLWYLAGSILASILEAPDQQLTPSKYSEDIAVRAVLHGWSTPASRYNLDAGWQWLRHLDEALYSSLGIPERLAILRIMRLQYLAQVHPETKHLLPLPDYLKARPAQLHVDHDPLVEHFVWPGVREHILFSPRKYATNKFMDEFREQSKFVWPFEPENTFMRNTMTGLYSYSPAFIERQKDLRCWTMRSDFFEKFPELRTDIPAFNPPLLNTGMRLSLPSPSVRDNSDNIVNNASALPQGEDDMDGIDYPFGTIPVTGQANPLEIADTPEWAPALV